MSGNTKTSAPAKFAHGTQEWAKSNVNIQTGCEHDCRYCYAKAMSIRFGRATSADWRTPVLRRRAEAKRYNRRGGRIMFPSSHDITQGNVEACLTVLKKLLDAGNEVLIVSKPSHACVKRICTALEPYKARVLFRFTIGSANDTVLGYWEPGAPSFNERLLSLEHAYAQGFATSMSMEPMLDGDPEALIEAVRPFVTDSVWIGRANKIRHIIRLNCPGDKEAARMANELMLLQNDEAMVRLYRKHESNPLIKWKDSIKRIAGLERPTEKGLDI